MDFARGEAPFLAPRVSVSSLMLQVLAALIPAAIAHVWFFGPSLEAEHLKREAELAQQKESAKQAGPAAIAEILRRKKQRSEEDH